MTRRPEFFYGGPGDEILEHEDRDEYIRELLDNMDEDPETIEVVKYQHVKPSDRHLPERVLEYLIDDLDEEYGNPEGDWYKPTPKMRELAQAFVEGVLEEYEPWACEPVSSEIVNVEEWREEND